MDLNASPEPEEDEVFPKPESEEENVQYYEHVDHEQSGASIARRVPFCLIMNLQDRFW